MWKVHELKNNIQEFDKLIRNLERISKKESILNSKIGEKAFLSLGKGNFHEWLKKLLPNTRLIIEPKIIGIGLAIHYDNGKLKKVITKNSNDLTKQSKLIRKIPKDICIKQRIEILGQLYTPKVKITDSKSFGDYQTIETSNIKKEKRFCAFRILNCKLNHFQAIKELEKLNFEIPETEVTNNITDVHLFQNYWKKGLIFKDYPTSGIVLKINSKKLQKHLGKNNVSINWAYSVY